MTAKRDVQENYRQVSEAPGRFTRRRRLTEKLFSIAHVPVLHIEITGKMETRTMPALAKNEDGTVPLVPVVNLDDGEAGLLIVPAVLLGVLEREVEYVGKKFELVRGEIVEGKNYRAVEVWELD